jgi:hypothetical protein
MKRISVTTCLIALVCTAVGNAQADTYTQGYDPSGAMFASQNDSGQFGSFAAAFDSFRFANSVNIDTVSWVGGYWNGTAPGNITAFTLQFLADDAGKPGTLLASYSLPGNANENALDPASSVYSYGENLSTPFLASANIDYWLSIVPDVAYPPQWGWHAGSGGDGAAYQRFNLNTPPEGPLDYDLAFSVSGQASSVPDASSTLALLSLAAASLEGMRRRFAK